MKESEKIQQNLGSLFDWVLFINNHTHKLGLIIWNYIVSW